MNEQGPTRKIVLWLFWPIAFLLLLIAYPLYGLAWALGRLGKGCRIAAEWLTDAAFDLTSS